jgi:hypothetical protein
MAKTSSRMRKGSWVRASSAFHLTTQTTLMLVLPSVGSCKEEFQEVTYGIKIIQNFIKILIECAQMDITGADQERFGW